MLIACPHTAPAPAVVPKSADGENVSKSCRDSAGDLEEQAWSGLDF
jgi:hypothetical protein